MMFGPRAQISPRSPTSASVPSSRTSRTWYDGSTRPTPRWPVAASATLDCRMAGDVSVMPYPWITEHQGYRFTNASASSRLSTAAPHCTVLREDRSYFAACVEWTKMSSTGGTRYASVHLNKCQHGVLSPSYSLDSGQCLDLVESGKNDGRCSK